MDSGANSGAQVGMQGTADIAGGKIHTIMELTF